MLSDLIGYDPATITITRHTKVANAGGYSWNETTLDPITVRIYRYTTHNQMEFNLPEGEVKQRTHGILAEPTADIVVGHNSYDTFTYEGRSFCIVAVRHYTDVNVDEQIQADCVAM